MDLSNTTERPWVPVDACTLPTADQPMRVADWDSLFATSVRAVERQGATRASLMLSGDESLVARVQELADAETTCCSFFTFTVRPLKRHRAETVVALDIEVPAARSDVLARLIGRAAH
jgi:hypothetical protein